MTARVAHRQPGRPARGPVPTVTAYLDTSALLRLVLQEPGAFDDLRSYEALVSSELVAVESAWTIDRLRPRRLSETNRLARGSRP